MALTEAQKFAEAIRASFKIPMADLSSGCKPASGKSTLSRSITRKNIGEKQTTVEGPGTAVATRGVKHIKKSRRATGPPVLPPLPKIVLNDMDTMSKGSSNPSESASDRSTSSRSPYMSPITPTSATTISSSMTSAGAESEGRDEINKLRDEDDYLDLEEGVIVELSRPPQLVTIQADVKPRLLEVYRTTTPNEGRVVYLGKDIASSDDKGHQRKVEDNKGLPTKVIEAAPVKRPRKVSIKRVRQWVYDLA